MNNLITIKEFKRQLGVSHQAIYYLISSGKLPSITEYGNRLIDLDDVLVKKYIEKKKQQILKKAGE